MRNPVPASSVAAAGSPARSSRRTGSKAVMHASRIPGRARPGGHERRAALLTESGAVAVLVAATCADQHTDDHRPHSPEAATPAGSDRDLRVPATLTAMDYIRAAKPARVPTRSVERRASVRSLPRRQMGSEPWEGWGVGSALMGSIYRLLAPRSAS